MGRDRERLGGIGRGGENYEEVGRDRDGGRGLGELRSDEVG